MRIYIVILCFISYINTNAQIEPFVDYDWTIEKIETSEGTTILADVNEDGDYDKMYIFYEDFIFVGYTYLFSECQGRFNFDDSNQTFVIEHYSCAITPNPTNIADHFLNVFILEEGGVTNTDDGSVYGPFSYGFSYTEDLVYLYITNLEGSVATFYATNFSQEEFLKDAIAIYPNPVLDILKIETSGIAIDNVKIYDLNGKLVEETKINQERQVNVSQLGKGVYVLHLETAVGLLKTKFVKE